MIIMKKDTVRDLTIVTSLVLGGWACQSTRDFADPAPEIKRLEDAQAEAKSQAVDILSPEDFTKSRQALNEAKERDAKDRNPAAALRQADEHLTKAIQTAAPARVTLQPVLDARAAALAAEAPKYREREWDEAEKQFKKATSDVGKGDLRTVERAKGDLLNRYANAEGDAIVARYLGESKNEFQKLERAGAAKWAPRTFDETKQGLNLLEINMRADKHNQALLAESELRAKDMTARLARIAGESKRLRSEKLALELDAKNAQVAAAQAATAAEQQKAADAEAQLKSADHALAEQKAMDERYQRARAMFSPQEAEVYKQGQQLLIRLKGLDFKTGQAELGSRNDALMVKLENVIKEFDNPSLRIEGHTDATGSSAKNLVLSDERAKAVKEALVSSLRLDETRISVEGFGDSKPIASNKTAQGRAQNRRVDVVIQPEATPAAISH